MGARNLSEIHNRMERLRNTENLTQKNNEWLIEVINGKKSIMSQPKWLTDITKQADTNENTATSTRKRTANRRKDTTKRVRFSIDNNEGDALNNNEGDALLSTITLGQCMTRIGDGGSGTHIIDSILYEYAAAKRGWTSTRQFILPGTNKIAWPNTEQTDIRNRARIDNDKLLMPINLKRDSGMNHYVCCFRFRAQDNNKHDWEFAVVDTQNNRSVLNEVKGVIENYTTLANGKSYLEEEKPDPRKANAQWNLLSCAQQIGTECGHRVVLHIMIATGCRSVRELMGKLEKLRNIKDLERKCRSWVDDLSKNGTNIPAWLSDII